MNENISDVWELAKEMKPGLLADSTFEVKFPYSILIAGIGVLLGILVCVLSFGMCRKSRDYVQQGQVLSNTQLLPLASVQEPH